MKKIIITLFAALISVAALNAKSASQLRVYINPGHGSYGANDRPMALVNKSSMDTTGFFESNTNLRKGFGVLEKLIQYGLTFDRSKNQTATPLPKRGAARDMTNNIVMSHVKCGGTAAGEEVTNTTGFNQALTAICEEVDANNFDYFISIHSNSAGSDGSLTNYPLFLYRGTDSEEKVAGSKSFAQNCWPYIYKNSNSTWTHTGTHNLNSKNVRGDITFYGSSSTYGYLGALKHNVPGFLVEGQFHTYQPARHRAMNWDVDYIEGYNYARGIADTAGLTKESTGDIYGLVRSADESSSSLSPYTAVSTSDDVYLPLNGATVTLKNSGGTTVATYTTDGFYNGAFVFKDITPGTYTVTAAKSGYVSQTKTVTVTAATTNYGDFTDGTHNFKLSIDTGGGGGDSGGDSGEVVVDYTGMTTHNPFAYDITTQKVNNGIRVNYKLVGRPTSVDVELYLNNTLVKTQEGSITANTNSVTFNMLGMAAGTYKAKVKVTGQKLSSATRVKDGNNNNMVYNFYAPWGVSCNNCTDSPTFGNVAVVESWYKQSDITSGYMSATGQGVGMGLYRFNANFTPIRNTSNTYGFTCGITPVSIGLTDRRLDLKRVKYTDDGRLFVGRSNVANSSVWEVYADMSAQQFFRGSGAYINQAGTEAGGGRMYTSNGGTFIAGPVMGFDFVGSGSNLKMVISSINIDQPNQNGNTNSYGVVSTSFWTRVDRYDIGTATSWFKAPSQNISNHAYWLNNNSSVAISNDLIYVTQYRGSPSDKQPSHVAYSMSGSVLQVAGPTSTGGVAASGAGAAFDRSRTLLAITRASGSVSVFRVNSNGSLGSALTGYDISGDVTNVSALAWDYADNLYVTSNNTEVVICYAMPRSSGVLTTPAPSTETPSFAAWIKAFCSACTA